MSREKVLITGGAGYLGQVLTPLLIDNGYNVLVYDPTATPGSLSLEADKEQYLELVPGDILNATQLAEAMIGVNIVIHLAAMPGAPACEKEPDRAIKINVEGTQTLLNAMKPEQKFIFASTDSCYGGVECNGGEVLESMPTKPASVYGRTKQEGEKLSLARGAVILRQVTLFGYSPRFRSDLLIHNLCREGMQTKQMRVFEGHAHRTFIHIKDSARGFLYAINNYQKLQGNVFNLGNADLAMTKEKLARTIAKNIGGVDVKVIAGDAFKDLDKRNHILSFEKYKEAGFKAEITLSEGLKEIIAHLQPQITAFA